MKLGSGILIFIISFSALSLAQTVHIVKPRDTLSGITLKYLGKKLYGDTGHLIQIIRINPHVGNPDLIYPGDQIYIKILPPASVVAEKPVPPLPEPSPEPEKKIETEIPAVTVDAIKEETPEEPFTGYRNQLSLGLGINFLTYQQTSASIGSNLSYSIIKIPAALLSVKHRFNRKFSLEGSIHDAVGTVKSANGITVTNGEYHWQTYTLEGISLLSQPRWINKETESLSVRYGLQYHTIPFIYPLTSTQVDIRKNTMTLLTGGIEYNKKYNSKWRGEALLRYQLPVLAGSRDANCNFSVSPRFAFDGSVGAIRQWTERSSWGLFWYGQSHDYNFNYNTSDYALSGNQVLFFSNLELRFLLDF